MSFQALQPLPNAEVRLVNVLTAQITATTHADKAGSFSFQSVPIGEYGIEAVNTEACDISGAFQVSEGSMTVVQLRLRDRELCSGPMRFAGAL